MNKNLFRIIVLVVTFSIGILAAYFGFFRNESTFINSLTPVNEVPPIELSAPSEFKEDYAVYSAILDDLGYAGEVVISEYTTIKPVLDLKNISSISSNLTQDVIEDFEKKNKKTQKLADEFTSEVQVIILNENDQAELFHKSRYGWEKFYKKYPNAVDLTSFSRVGFNREKTQALVYSSNRCGFQCEGEMVAFLEKENDKWIVRQNMGLSAFKKTTADDE